MSKVQKTFKRYEVKYLVSKEQRKRIEKAIEAYVVPDRHGNNTICNVYYDTPDHRLIRKSLEKPVYKEKLRLRSYGSAKADDMVFMELKKKYKHVVYKRRLHLSEKEAHRYLESKEHLLPPSQIGEEIDYFRELYGEIGPSMYISYDRTAYYAKDDQDLRITFDSNILWRENDLSLNVAPYGSKLLEKGQSVMEIKTALAMPLWLTHILSECELYKTSYSKYGKAYLTTLKEHEIGGVHCA